MTAGPVVARMNTPFHTASYQMLGFPFEVHTDVPDLGVALGALLAGFRASAPFSTQATVFELKRWGAVDRQVEVRVDDEIVVRAVDAGSAVDHLIAGITRRAIRSDHPYLAVHAGAVSRDGAGVLIPGASGSGKSTLTCALVRAGWGFLSDEVALLEPGSSWVHPFPRPAALSPDSMLLLRLAPSLGSESFRHFEHHLSADELRPGSTARPVRIRFIVVPDLVPNSVAALEPMTRSDTLELLLHQCFDLGRQRGQAVVALGELVKGVDCYRLRMGAMTSAVEVVGSLSK